MFCFLFATLRTAKMNNRMPSGATGHLPITKLKVKTQSDLHKFNQGKNPETQYLESPLFAQVMSNVTLTVS